MWKKIKIHMTKIKCSENVLTDSFFRWKQYFRAEFISMFDSIILLTVFPFLYFYCFSAGYIKCSRKVEFTKSKNGEQILLIDQHRYFKDKENEMAVFWKCHEFYKSKCEASVTTMKKDRTRVVVMNDTHIHLQPRKASGRRR